MAFSGAADTNWRTNCKTFLERWSEAKKRKLFTDVDFLVGEGDEKVIFSAHKNIFALGSPVFEELFYASPKPTMTPITVNTSPEVFSIVLSHLYGEKTYFASIPIAAMTAFIAEQCGMEDLRAAATAYIQYCYMDDSQFWDLYSNQKFMWNQEVQKRCVDYLERNAKTILQSGSLMNISTEMMEQIIRMEKLDISEFELLSALVEWGTKVSQATQIELKVGLKPYLYHIRFTNVYCFQFCELHEKNPSFIDMADALAIIKHLENRFKYSLPDWCCKSDEQRNKHFTLARERLAAISKENKPVEAKDVTFSFGETLKYKSVTVETKTEKSGIFSLK